MAKNKKKNKVKKKTKVDVWLERETAHIRKALENASSYFDGKDVLTVNTLEAIYGQESSFGALLNERGIDGPSGHFQLSKITAKNYGLIVSEKNDQRFDIDYASIAAARYLKDLDGMFGKATPLSKDRATVPIGDAVERQKFVLAAYDDGQGKIAQAQYLAQKDGKDPTKWEDVQKFLGQAGNKPDKVKEICQYVDNVPKNETEFAKKSSADKKAKDKKTGCEWALDHKKSPPHFYMGLNYISFLIAIIFLCGCASNKEAARIFGNKTYFIVDALDTDRVNLVNGKYEEEDLRVQYARRYVYGDFNHDGLKDAAVIIIENTGGNLDAYTLAFLINDGKELVHKATIFLDDEARINSICERNNKVFVDMYVHQEGDCNAGPTKRVKELFEYPGPNIFAERKENGTIARIDPRELNSKAWVEAQSSDTGIVKISGQSL